MTAHKTLRSKISPKQQQIEKTDMQQYASWLLYAFVAFIAVALFFGGIALLFSSEVL